MQMFNIFERITIHVTSQPAE